MIAAAAAFLAFAGPAAASTPSAERAARDGVVRVFGPGGPHTAYIRAAEAFESMTGHPVEVVWGPERTWTAEAKRGADILFGSAEHSMTAFLKTYDAFRSEDVSPIYIRRAVIAVQKGNPKGIAGIADLLEPGIGIVVTEGAGVSNTSGTGVWEDVAGRLGSLDDVRRLRANIVAFEQGSGASFRAFRERNADAWITWIHWPLTNPDAVDVVEIEPERAIHRVTNIVVSADADPEARSFANFLTTDAAAAIFAAEGWSR